MRTLSLLIGMVSICLLPFLVMVLWGSLASDLGLRTIGFGTSVVFVILATLSTALISAGRKNDAQD